MNIHQHEERISSGFGGVRIFVIPSPGNGQIVSQKHNFMIQAIIMFVLVCTY